MANLKLKKTEFKISVENKTFHSIDGLTFDDVINAYKNYQNKIKKIKEANEDDLNGPTISGLIMELIDSIFGEGSFCSMLDGFNTEDLGILTQLSNYVELEITEQQESRNSELLKKYNERFN